LSLANFTLAMVASVLLPVQPKKIGMRSVFIFAVSTMICFFSSGDSIEVSPVETVVGLRPGSPDNAPMLGPAGPEGLVVATGHYRNGILLTPVTADAIAELLATGRVPELIAPFAPGRFAGAPTGSAGRRS
jgi:hypothetical protein